MKKIMYWMAFQILVGAWLFISPLVWGCSTMMRASVNNVIFGAIVMVLCVGSWMHEYYRSKAASYHEISPGSERYEHIEKKAA